MWLTLYHDCHEFVSNGTYGTVKGRKDKVKMIGSYRRIEWPFSGGVMDQPNVLVQAFQVINNQLSNDQMIGIEIQV